MLKPLLKGFSKKKNLVITGVNTITSVGHDAYMTAGAVNAGVSALKEDPNNTDYLGNPIVVSRIEEISRKQDEFEFMLEVNEKCFVDLLTEYYGKKDTANKIIIMMGLEHPDKKSIRDEDLWVEHIKKLTEEANKYSDKVSFIEFSHGNPSAFFAIKNAEIELKENPDTTFIVGSMDSLLYLNHMDELHKNKRIKSCSFGQNHGMSPSHASGFMVIEEEGYALKRERDILASIKGVAVTKEEDPVASERPSKYQGLSSAVNESIKEYNIDKTKIKTLFTDLNGEYARSKEWSFVKVRCFKENNPHIIHPADCFGSIGAAYSSVLTCLASVYISEGWVEDEAMVLCSDDYGYCGALNLAPYIEEEK